MKVHITREIMDMISQHMAKNNISLSEFARQSHVSKAWLSELRNKDANLSVETATYLLNSLGYDLQIVKKKSASTENSSIENNLNIKKTASRLRKVVECKKQ